MSEELGRLYPCFGEFRCSHCGRQWQSAKAWADFGEECQSCAATVNPCNLQKLFIYICGRCQTEWKWAYQAQGMCCIKCSPSTLVRPLDPRNYADREYIRAHRLAALSDVDENENHIDPTREHREELCEKCIRYGRPCGATAGQVYPRTNVAYHQRDVLSTVSNRVHQINSVPTESSRTNILNTSSVTSPRTSSVSFASSSESDSSFLRIIAIVLMFGVLVYAMCNGKA